ncbi:MAG: Gfo/Idh/MocA family oxidoreductase [Pirellulales bacterium]
MRLGLIGLKGHQSVVLNGARQLGDVELVAVSDDDARALDRFVRDTAQARQAQKYADWRHLVEHTMMDVCCVCDENHVRAEQLLALAKRSIHIVTEKPLTTTLADLDRVRTALAESKSKLTMLLTMRHEARYAKMRELVQSGVIGEVCQISVQKSYRLEDRPEWFKSRQRLGGTIPYIGIHAVDLMSWVSGLRYRRVAAFHGRIGSEQIQETENHASILLELTNGGSATARLDYLRPSPAPTHGDDRLRLAGTEGVLEARGGEPKLMLVTSKNKPYTVDPGSTANLFAEFVQAVRADKPYRIPAEDCFYATEVVLKAREAADEKKLVELQQAKA